MKLYKATVSVRGSKLTSYLQSGVLASAEVAFKGEGGLVPTDKVNLIAADGDQGPAAWIQILRFDEAKNYVVTHEGWINSGTSSLSSPTGQNAVEATVEAVEAPNAETAKCHEKVTFGTFACCTAQGPNCTVTCCNSCCSITSCPGATCCA